MAFESKDGRKFSMASRMHQHNRSMDAKQDKAPGTILDTPGEGGEGGEPEPEMGDRPMMTEHHADGSHTTTHESGAVKHHASAEELVEHLHKHLPEEEQEIEQGDEGGDDEEY